MAAKIDVISSCLVKMATNGHDLTTLHLTPWDLRFLPLDTIQKGLLFHKPTHPSPHQLSDHLKNSLSRTLAFFPLLSGRLGIITDDHQTTSFFIDCNDAGADFTYAVASGVSVSSIVEPNYVPEIVSSFFPLNDIRNYEGVSKPLLAVQVTELEDGFFIGCMANHAIVDGASFWHFFNSWSEISRGFSMISKAPVFDRWFPSNIFDKNHLITLPPLDQNPMHKIAPPPLLERIFHFSKDKLAKLKAKANFEADSGNKISTLQALSAHLWLAIVRCRQQQSAATDNINLSKQESTFAVLVSARDRIPLQEGYFGNTVHAVKTAVGEDKLLQNGLGFAALKIHELVSQQTREAMIKFVEDWVDTPSMPKAGSVNIVITGSHRYDVYSCDFGWGKPIVVRSGGRQKFRNKVTVYSAAQSGGIDAEVCLAPETMKAIEDDADFLQYVS